MKYLPFFLFIFLFSYQEKGNIYAQDCSFMPRPFFKIDRADGKVNLDFTLNNTEIVMEYPKNTCLPDSVDVYISEDNDEFNKIDRFDAEASSIPIDGLENDKFYFFKIVNLHSQLDFRISLTLSIKPGKSNPSISSDKSFPTSIDEYAISNDGQHVIYEAANKRSWHLTSFANPQLGKQLFDQSSKAIWLNDDSKIACIKLIKEDNYIRSHKINIYDLSSNQETTLHTIANPKECWIHSLEASLDGMSIFFKSNKDKGTATGGKKRIYDDNIWKINIETGKLEQLSDFFPINLKLHNFAEDPLNPNNFYVIVNYRASSEKDIKLCYLNTTNQTLTPILEDEFMGVTLLISPSGDKVLLSSQRTGVSELWVYNINTSNLSQITDSQLHAEYLHLFWFDSDICWKDNNTLLTYMEVNDKWQFIEFEVEVE